MTGKSVCILCSRRIYPNKPRVRIGSSSVWPLMEIHSQKKGLDLESFSKQDFICMKCYATISHYRMSDRGPNKKTNASKPIDGELVVTKHSLRSSAPKELASLDCDAGTFISNTIFSYIQIFEVFFSLLDEVHLSVSSEVGLNESLQFDIENVDFSGPNEQHEEVLSVVESSGTLFSLVSCHKSLILSQKSFKCSEMHFDSGHCFQWSSRRQ